MSDRAKTILQILGIVVVFFLVAPYLLRGWLALTTKSRTVVRYPDAVHGRITGVEINRQNHQYFLNGDTKRYYSFNAFGPPLTPALRQLNFDEQNRLGLGQHLAVGDYVAKEANSTTLVVRRGDSTSQWFCSKLPAAE